MIADIASNGVQKAIPHVFVQTNRELVAVTGSGGDPVTERCVKPLVVVPQSVLSENSKSALFKICHTVANILIVPMCMTVVNTITVTSLMFEI